MKLLLTAAVAATLALGACTDAAPVDNGAATSCTPGTVENKASSVCEDVELANGTTVVANAE